MHSGEVPRTIFLDMVSIRMSGDQDLRPDMVRAKA